MKIIEKQHFVKGQRLKTQNSILPMLNPSLCCLAYLLKR